MPRRKLKRCHFCGCYDHQVKLLLKGKLDGMICDVCVLLAVHGLADRLREEVDRG